MWARQLSVEFVDCHIQDAAGDDQWAATYPNVTRLGIVAGGGEIRNETTVVIDSSLALALLPFSPVVRADITGKIPMYIPVNAGQTITIKCSLRKTQFQATGRRPMIHMFGAGIDTYSEMTDINNIWEEQTITGVATITDSVKVWISCINEHDGACVYQPDCMHSPHVLGWLTVYADKFSVVIT